MNILSIQSSVAYGHVGNSAAVFPLQRLGAEVWAVNTVQFSNHTGYGAWRGKVFGAGLMETLHPEDALISGLFNCALVCAAIMACVCDSLLAGRPMPYSWRFPMALIAPLLPLSSAMVAWRSRRWCSCCGSASGR